MILAAAGAAGGGDVWAADIFAIEALSASGPAVEREAEEDWSR
jgi:hypothetical protein